MATSISSREFGFVDSFTATVEMAWKVPQLDSPPPARDAAGVRTVEHGGHGDRSPAVRVPESSSGADYVKPGVKSIEDYGYGSSGRNGESTQEGYRTAVRSERRFSMPSMVSSATVSIGCTTIPMHQGESTQEGYHSPVRSERRLSMPSMVSSATPSSDSTTIRRSSIRQDGSPRRNSIAYKGELEITLPPVKKGEGRRRVIRRTSLSFQDEAEVTTIEPAHELSSKKDLWFQDNEIKQIHKQVNAIVHKTDNGYVRQSGKKYCVRGLERLMHPELTSMTRGVAWDAVLTEQYLQLQEGVYKEEHVANLYKFSTMHSQKDAVTRAMEDAKEVAKYLESTRRIFRRGSC